MNTTKVTAGAQTPADTEELKETAPPAEKLEDSGREIEEESRTEAKTLEIKEIEDKSEVLAEDHPPKEDQLSMETDALPDAAKEAEVIDVELPEDEVSVRGVTKVTVNIATSS